MTTLNDFGAGIDSEQPTSASARIQSHNCQGITSSGTQCENNPTSGNSLCTVHENAYGLRRVDEFDSPTAPDLRDALRDKCGIRGRRAYALATLTDDVHELWEILTDPDAAPIELGEKTLSFKQMVNYASEVANHPDLPVDDHLFAQEKCVAKTGRGRRCSHGASGPLRLCSTHKENKTVTVIRGIRDQYVDLRDDPNIDTAR
jgi:hypothetical protein